MSSKLPTGELPEDLAIRVMRIYGEDPLSDLPALLRASDLTSGQLAAQIARQCFEGQWRGRMSVQTADQIRCEVDNAFTPPEDEPVDPVAESAQRRRAEWDPWLRDAELQQHVTVIGGDHPLAIEDTRQPTVRPSVVITGGKPKGGKAA